MPTFTLVKEPKGGVPPVVDSLSGFEEALFALKKAPGPVAVDAERAAMYRYSHKNYLIQMKKRGTPIFLFDAPALLSLGADLSRLSSLAPRWVLHDSIQDVPAFCQMGIIPPALFDTQVACMFLGMERMGLSRCTESFLGLSLEKEFATADWSLRPLPRPWRNYAALDVEFLLEIEEIQDRELEEKGVRQWAEDEFSTILQKGIEGKRRKDPWRGVSNINALGSDRRALAIVRELWQAREQVAMKLDLAPGLVLKDETIIALALKKPKNEKEFKETGAEERVRVEKMGELDGLFDHYIPCQRRIKPKIWKEAVEKAMEIKPSSLPLPAASPSKRGSAVPNSLKIWEKRHPDKLARLERAMEAVQKVARSIDIPSVFLISPRLLREYFWMEPEGSDCEKFLRSKGVNDWRLGLIVKVIEASNL
ncbi:MAG: HRDC domain-containing protein [Bifidobacteriaceae bacterium]|nr:HRDC domain-containing protein [Bifidobacteriaceae bacterium]